MKRTVITVDGNGMLSIPSNLQDLWMSEGELVDMLHVTAMKLHAVIRSIYKDGLLTVSEVQQKQGNHPKYADLLIAKKLASVYSRVFL